MLILSMSRKGQATSVTGIVVGVVLAIIISAIIVYDVGFPTLTAVNTSGNVPSGQQSNFSTVLLLLGVTVIIVALVGFMMLTRLVA